MKIADLIKQIRATGLSQSDIARETRIPQPRLSKWENGKASPSVDDALRLVELAERRSRVKETAA